MKRTLISAVSAYALTILLPSTALADLMFGLHDYGPLAARGIIATPIKVLQITNAEDSDVTLTEVIVNKGNCAVSKTREGHNSELEKPVRLGQGKEVSLMVIPYSCRVVSVSALTADGKQYDVKF
ncbi:MAG: hypothetical protein AB1766_08420 [Pseudomonadota bacterium]|jgi:hypothetical protein